jgi:hypothetical protein
MFNKNFKFGSKFLLFDPHRSAKQEVFGRGDAPWKENTNRFRQLGSKDLKVERESARRLTYCHVLRTDPVAVYIYSLDPSIVP